MLFGCSVGYSQEDLESKAVEYFCKNVLKIDPSLKGMDIIYNLVVEARPSKVYDVADCMGDINLLKDSIPNAVYLDSLEQAYIANQYSRKYLRLSCSLFKKKRSIFKRDVFYMEVYSPIIYNDKKVIEIFLHNKKVKNYRIVVLTFKEGEVSNHCLKHIIYD